MKRSINLVYIAIALEPGITLESSGLMDTLSNLRDGDENHVKMVEWAVAPNPYDDGKRGETLVDGESEPMLALFESNSVSPSRTP